MKFLAKTKTIGTLIFFNSSTVGFCGFGEFVKKQESIIVKKNPFRFFTERDKYY
jgi:hypothetical protein